VSFDRLHFGDNDRLAAMVTSLLDADLLILLSVVNGVLDESGATVHVAESRDHIRSLVRDEKSSTGVGGMMSKLDSAEFAMSAGADVVIASGLTQGVVGKVVDGKKVGTRFAARPSASARKRWLATARPRGALVVDAGATRALQGGASLLPAGITQIKGSFESGSIVAIEGDDGLELARGLASYSSSELDRIKGRHSDEIERVLGFVYSPEAVHREDLYMHYEPGGDL
jgi:glutamate 5-kinase